MLEEEFFGPDTQSSRDVREEKEMRQDEGEMPGAEGGDEEAGRTQGTSGWMYPM